MINPTLMSIGLIIYLILAIYSILCTIDILSFDSDDKPEKDLVILILIMFLGLTGLGAVIRLWQLAHEAWHNS